MTHVPYGYKIENGVAMIDEPVAETVRALFEKFIECKSMRAAANAAGIEKTHSVIGRMIKNTIYLGTDFYPQIIDEGTFNKAQEIRNGNAKSQNRLGAMKPHAPIPTSFSFELGRVATKYEDPYKQAEYAYSQVKEISG